MTMRAALLLVVMALAGCASVPITAVPAQCNAMCFQPCVGEGEDTGVRVTASGDTAQAWDEIGGEVTTQLATKLRTCDARRAACVQCLLRLDATGAIVL